jgi:ABC-2 type transport system permease protein
MRNVRLVIKHEILTTLGKPSFWFTAFAIPLITFAITFGSQYVSIGLSKGDGAPAGTPAGGIAAFLLGDGGEAQKPLGYVDQAGVIERIPDDFANTALREYADLTSASAGLDAGEIDQYYVIPPDVLETGGMELIQGDFSPIGSMGSDNPFELILTYNLTGDADVASLLAHPMPSVASEPLVTDPEGADAPVDPGAQQLVSMLMLFVFFFVITMSSGFMLRSVSKEKENRVVEVLLLSLRPRDLMLGKMLGLGVVALLQMAIWLGGSLFTLGGGVPALGLSAMSLSSLLPPGFLVWAILYFVLGYLTYSAALAALGALAPTMREGSQFTFVVLLPLMIPLWLNMSFSEAPRGALVTFLSMFPLTSPVSMVTRMMAIPVPLWQVLVSLLLLGATTYGFVLLSARFFRSDTLLSSAPLNMNRLKRELLGRRG